MVKNLAFLLVALACIAIAGYSYFEDRKQVDIEEQALRDIETRIVELSQINSWQNELLLRSRAGLDVNYDDLVLSSFQMEQSINGINNLMERHEIDSRVVSQFSALQNAAIIKLDDVESFKSHNSVLRNSERYMPIVGNQLAAIALQQDLDSTAQLLTDIVSKVSEYTKIGSKIYTEQQLGMYKEEINRMFDVMPQHSNTKLLEFLNHYNTALSEKTSTDGYLVRSLAEGVSEQLTAMSGLVNQILSNREFRYGAQTTILSTATAVLVLVLLIWMLSQQASENRLNSRFVEYADNVSEQVELIRIAVERLEHRFETLHNNGVSHTIGRLVLDICDAAKQRDNVRVNGGLKELVKLDRQFEGLDDAVVNDSFFNDASTKIGTVKESLDYLKSAAISK